MDGIAQSNQMPLPLECGDFDNKEDVDNEGGTASREIHTMDIGIEGSLTPKGSHSDGPDRGSGSCELPATNVSSHRWETGSRAQTRNHDNDNGNDTHIAFDTQVESDERDPSPSITFILLKMNLQVASIPSHQGGLPHRFMVCTTCGMGLDPDDAVNHATSKDQSHHGHGINVLLHERRLVRQWIVMASDLHLAQNPLPIPDAHSPPVSGLKIFKGYRCPTCGECKESEGMMKRHSSSTGHRKPRGASIQFFFSIREKKYFVVQPGRQLEQKTKGCAEKDVDMYALYAKSFGLDIEEKLPFYCDDKEMPVMLQITRWFDHVWPYLRLREDDVEEDSDNSGNGSSEEEGSDADGEDTQDEVPLDEDDETRAGTKRK
jgi:hypothetical protein